ncbi:MAG: DNA translocase FtsK 4TM domain-containing protein [Kiritimatiellae bacterium]|nr:DNA translocase FtsK 4TM domain-containing protein [Kiritimatiellia bacterium]
MTDTSSNGVDTSREKHVFGWFIFPIMLLFPLVALLTYDWRAIASLQTPPQPTTNWVGALGDTFAYHGYVLVGLAVWAIPIACIALGLVLVFARRGCGLKNIAWFLLFLAACACLLQVTQHHAPGIKAALERLNLANAGGVIGYLVMTRFLSPLLSDFAGSVIMILVAIVALVEVVGPKNIAVFFVALYRWATAHGHVAPSREAAGSDEEYEQQQAAYLAALQAKQDAKEQARLEKEQARLEKERAKAEKAAARQAEKEAIRAAKEAARAEREAVKPAERAPVQGEPAQEETVVDKGPYILPSLSLLNPLRPSAADHSDVGEMSQRLVSTLKLFGVDAKLDYTVQGPVVTKYAIELAPGTRYSAVTNLTDNLKGALHAKSIRIEAPIPGEDRIGIEVPNRKSAGISFREIFESEAWRGAKAELPLLFGKRADGKELVSDLASMPHMLVAGATGQGKSVCLNSLICGLLMTRTPEQLKLIMVDPKSVEFTPYASIPHLLVPVITDNRKVVFSLHWAVAEMEKRLKMFARARVRNIYDFNHRATFTQTDMFGGDTEVSSDMPKTVPYIVIIIDEVADLMSQCSKEVTPDISRLTAKARAAGIHLILATQRPDAKIITGTIKANIPGRVAFKTASSVDSRTILDDTGAENLIGKGDMLFKGKDGLLIRAQGAWISDDEIANITNFIQEHSNTQFDEKFATKLGRVKEASIEDPFASNEDDPDNQQQGEDTPSTREMVKANEDADLFKRALECIINTNRASVSHFQRRLGIGYNHAAKLCDKLEDAGVIGPQQGAGPRPIIMDQQQLLAIFNGNGSAADGESAGATPEPEPNGELANQEEPQ